MTTPTSRTLYKYLEEQYAASMLATGNIRIGTLYEYRDHWNDQVQDKDEGTYTAYQQENVTVLGGEKKGLITEAFDISEGGSLTLENFAISIPRTIADNNIYCTTLTASKVVMEEFKCEACIEINNSEGFLDAIEAALIRADYPIVKHVSDKCTYDGRVTDYTKETRLGLPAGYWMKAPFYKPQQEWRTVFESMDKLGIKKPIIIDIPEIRQFIKRHEFPT